MIKNRKTRKVLIFSIVLVIAIAIFFGLANNLKKDSKYYAEKFLEVFTNPEDRKLIKNYYDMFESETKTAYNFILR